MQNKKIAFFWDLIAWQKGHDLVKNIYVSTRSFPRIESYGLTSQIRRAAVSITSNIAEGYARQSFREKIRFYNISLGSLFEIQNQILLARDLNYIDVEVYKKLWEQCVEARKLIRGLIRSTQLRI